MAVPTSIFLQKMEDRWVGFGNVVSKPLRQAWVQLCETFNDKVRAITDPQEEEVWRVISPPTGSGKTQGMIVYAAMLSMPPRELHPGMLIVTRMIHDADGIAEQINELSQDYSEGNATPQAISYHSEKKGRVSLSDLSKHSVLVITHEAYKIALDRFSISSFGIEGTWDAFYTFGERKRRLVVIDEAIDLVDYSEITLEEINALLYYSEPIKSSFPLERKALEAFKVILEGFKARKDVPHKEMVIVDRPANDWGFMQEEAYAKLKDAGLTSDCAALPDFVAFGEALRAIRFDTLQFKKDSKENMRMKQKCLDMTSAVDSLLKTHIFYSRNESKPTFNTSRLLVPPDVKGAIIMDATATCNVIYELFDRAQKMEPPPDVRDYSNVTLHVSFDHRAGSRDMKSGNALERCQQLVPHMEGKLASKNKKVLTITHKDVEPFMLQCLPQSFSMSVAHWGAIDGKNTWDDHDTVIIYGLPYKPKRWSASLFMALQGVQENEWFHDPSKRSFKDHKDIRAAINTGQMVTDLVQGINRIRCRRVIDEQGNCPHTDVYLLLPSRGEADPLLEGIRKEMPGIKVVDWHYDHQKQKKRGRKGNYAESLLAYLKQMKPGDRLSASTIKKDLKIPERTWKRLVQRLRNRDDVMNAELQALGIQYHVERTKKTSRAFFIRLGK